MKKLIFFSFFGSIVIAQTGLGIAKMVDERPSPV
jgi:hypothetical protein